MQWHQLDNTQTICTSLQTDNHHQQLVTQFLQAGCSSCRPNNSVKALKAQGHGHKCTIFELAVWDRQTDRRTDCSNTDWPEWQAVRQDSARQHCLWSVCLWSVQTHQHLTPVNNNTNQRNAYFTAAELSVFFTKSVEVSKSLHSSHNSQ